MLRPMRRILNSLLGVWKCDQKQSFVFDILILKFLYCHLFYLHIVFTSWYDVSHAMGFRVCGRNSIKNHSLTFVRQLIYALSLD